MSFMVRYVTAFGRDRGGLMIGLARPLLLRQIAPKIELERRSAIGKGVLGFPSHKLK
jgi:hypothetical protein